MMGQVRLILHGVAGCLFLFLAACSVTQPNASKPAVARIPAPKPESRATEAQPFQVGLASWYGPGFHGKVTASGKAFDQHDHTAAHRTLPLGTRVRVTNLANGQSTEVTIIDRGPFAKNRVIDLSAAAAKDLGMTSKGTTRVRIEVIEDAADAEKIRSELDDSLRFGLFG
ncbi:MAG TPA: septal ring lytic transglycosylase RlpA family protein [Verrucomicrobiae bacterium]|jgi:rare lipoprotein A|nr:septal ring lytic transglycosylase RlpA family protein [Verrucomicrobiae bacterium]